MVVDLLKEEEFKLIFINRMKVFNFEILKIKYGKSWKDIRHARALIIKQKLPEHSARFNDNTSKIKSFQLYVFLHSVL